MKVLELFAGSATLTKIARQRGHEACATDIHQFGDIDVVEDVRDLSFKYAEHADMIWASPPCTAFSVASIGKHWGGGKRGYVPKTEEAKEGISLLYATIRLMNRSNAACFIENPRGMMRKLKMMKYIPRRTVTYCQYGDTRMKPTDIWTNTSWRGRKMCKNGDSCHASAPRGARTGTQGKQGAYERGILPEQLCREILEHVEKYG